jgi:hypothetical protein
MRLLFLALTLLTSASCASSPRPEVIVHDGPRGTVYLGRVADRNFQATHPIKLDQAMIARVMTGVYVVDAKTALQMLFSIEGKTWRAFSDEEAAFLSPFLTSALAQAAPEQQAVFRLLHAGPGTSPRLPGGAGAAVGSSISLPAGSQNETTTGTLYVHGRSLHFTLADYRRVKSKPDVIGGPNRYYPEPDAGRRDVRFIPQSVLRPDSFRQSTDSPQTLVVDYEALGKQPEALAGPATVRTPFQAGGAAPSAATDVMSKNTVPEGEDSLPRENQKQGSTGQPIEEVRTLKDLVVKKDMELESIKEELRVLRRQLDERDVQLEGLRKKAKPAQKSPDALR